MTAEQEKALRDYLQESIVPLIEQVLVKKLGQAMSFAAEQLVQPKRTWVGLTDDDVRKINQEVWGYVSADHTRMRGYACAIEAKLKELNT
jgi:hypothetical protein